MPFLISVFIAASFLNVGQRAIADVPSSEAYSQADIECFKDHAPDFVHIALMLNRDLVGLELSWESQSQWKVINTSTNRPVATGNLPDDQASAIETCF